MKQSSVATRLAQHGACFAAGTAAEIMIPEGTSVIDTRGETMMPGMIEVHAPLIIVGHGDCERWFKWLAKGRQTLLRSSFVLVCCAAYCMALAQQPSPQQQLPSQLPDGEGKALVERVCSQCHSLETVTRSHFTRKQWEGRIDQMIAKGAKLSDDDIDVVADYLAKHFGPG